MFQPESFVSIWVSKLQLMKLYQQKKAQQESNLAYANRELKAQYDNAGCYVRVKLRYTSPLLSQYNFPVAVCQL